MRIRDNSILVLVMTTATTWQKTDILRTLGERTLFFFFFWARATQPEACYIVINRTIGFYISLPRVQSIPQRRYYTWLWSGNDFSKVQKRSVLNEKIVDIPTFRRKKISTPVSKVKPSLRRLCSNTLCKNVTDLFGRFIILGWWTRIMYCSNITIQSDAIGFVRVLQSSSRRHARRCDFNNT